MIFLLYEVFYNKVKRRFAQYPSQLATGYIIGLLLEKIHTKFEKHNEIQIIIIFMET